MKKRRRIAGLGREKSEEGRKEGDGSKGGVRCRRERIMDIQMWEGIEVIMRGLK